MGEKKKKQQLPFLLPVSEDKAACLSVCVWQKEKGREREREIEMKQSSPYVKSDWNILAISHRVAYIIWEA